MKHKVVKINQRTAGGTVTNQTAESKVKIQFADAKLKQTYLKSRKKNPLLYKWLRRAFDKITKNPRVGRYVPKNQIPKKYILKYDVDNM